MYILECFCIVGMATGTPFTTVASDTKAPQKLSHSAQQSANGNPSLDGAVKSKYAQEVCTHIVHAYMSTCW